MNLSNGEVVGVTAVYDKSISAAKIESGIDALYGKWNRKLPIEKQWLWRIEPERFTIVLEDRTDGTKSVTYLKFGEAVLPLHIGPATKPDAVPNISGELPSSFEQALGLAEAQPKDRETRTYSAVDLMPYYQQKYMPVFQACLKTMEHPDTSNFAFVVTIGADGHVLRIYIDNETTLFACVRPTLEKEQFPHPPFAPYYMNISMQFSK